MRESEREREKVEPEKSDEARFWLKKTSPAATS